MKTFYFQIFFDTDFSGHRLLDPMVSKVCESEAFVKGAVRKVAMKVASEQVRDLNKSLLSFIEC